jgi:hypothetical protein
LIKEIEKLSRHLSAKALETASLRSQYEINTREIVANEAKLCQLLREENKTLELLSKQGNKLVSLVSEVAGSNPARGGLYPKQISYVLGAADFLQSCPPQEREKKKLDRLQYFHY